MLEVLSQSILIKYITKIISNTETAMKVFIYKRTHTGDPGESGVFGINDCMGKMRNGDYDAVIGIGGKTAPKEIKYKINWIGLIPKKISSPKRNGDVVVFANFKLYEDCGNNIQDYCPNLFNYMYNPGRRFTKASNLPENVLEEVKLILDSIKDCPASPAYNIEREDDLDAYIKGHSSKCGGCPESEETETTSNNCEKRKPSCKHP